jgi:hypothetical protein
MLWADSGVHRRSELSLKVIARNTDLGLKLQMSRNAPLVSRREVWNNQHGNDEFLHRLEQTS